MEIEVEGKPLKGGGSIGGSSPPITFDLGDSAWSDTPYTDWFDEWWEKNADDLELEHPRAMCPPELNGSNEVLCNKIKSHMRQLEVAVALLSSPQMSGVAAGMVKKSLEEELRAATTLYRCCLYV